MADSNCAAPVPLPLYLEVLRWIGMVGLLFMSGSFSGLNLGLMGLDKVSLEVIMTDGDAKDKERARKIMPIRNRGNFLLCTILLGNVAVNSLFAILSADVTDGMTGFLLSTLLIVIFGEIVPQALCSRYPLAVGSAYRHFVRFFMLLTSPLSYPVSFLLDKILGEEVGHIYSRKELKKLVDVHHDHNQLTAMETTILSGVLDFVTKKVEDVMTPLENVYRVNIETAITLDTMAEMMGSGHSRIPVYEGHKDNIAGLLFVKDLVLLNPENHLPLKEVLQFCGRPLMKVFYDEPLEKILAEFKRGESHLAVVHRVNQDGPGDPFYENIGIITLEDVIEELINDEILDETDDAITQHHKQRHNRLADFVRQKSARFRQMLTPEQRSGVEAFLREKVTEFSSENISSAVFARLMTQVVVEEISAPPGMPARQLYTVGKPSAYFTLVLKGALEVSRDGEVTEIGQYGYLGLECLTKGKGNPLFKFIPDFTARVVAPSIEVLRISKDLWEMAKTATTISSRSTEYAPVESETPIMQKEMSSTSVSIEMRVLEPEVGEDDDHDNLL